MYCRKLCIAVAALALVVPSLTLVGCDEGQKSGIKAGNTGADRADRSRAATGTGQEEGNPSDIAATTKPTMQPLGVDIPQQHKSS